MSSLGADSKSATKKNNRCHEHSIRGPGSMCHHVVRESDSEKARGVLGRE